ncbi:MAG TPA: cytochrome c oxidase subunit 4 [Candidatus Dormibacteraeota bacterium]|nr:cytochrome c oxidase subunit 4 [Candidatus Dormibacteraeota bacterium]
MAEDEENTSVDEPAEAHDHDHDDHDHAEHGDHGHDEEIHMPPNSWWPMVTAIGIAIGLVGILFLDLPFIIAIGVIVMVGGIVMWVVDARKEYQELH